MRTYVSRPVVTLIVREVTSESTANSSDCQIDGMAVNVLERAFVAFRLM